MLVQQVILENFMSYEYARLPFRGGVNVICGPNGSGKSSLLLATSVALGQTYTERSRKLSDLIRWGRDQARVTLILNNAKSGKTRPIPKINKDQIFLTRVLRRDGQYWFELDNRAATKADVDRLLSRLGVDPNNILIIMHQNMVEQFTVLSQQEKLKIVEAAVGLEPYRENVLQAQKKLTRILSQEDSIDKLLETAEQTLNYWREQYDKYQEKKQLQTKRRFLERELAWAEVNRKEVILQNLEAKMKEEKAVLSKVEEELGDVKGDLQVQQNESEKMRDELRTLFDYRIHLEREKAKNESMLLIFEQLQKETSMLVLDAQLIPSEIAEQASAVRMPAQTHFKLLRSENLVSLIQDSNTQLAKLSPEITGNQDRARMLEKSGQKISDLVLENRIKLALLQYRQDNAEAILRQIEKEAKSARNHIDAAVAEAEQSGPRIAVVKEIGDVLDEVRLTEGHLAALADVSEDIERMYESYSQLYLELKEKAKLVAENREKTLEEVKTRMHAWREVMQSLLARVSLEYQGILSQAQALGEVRIANEQDIEEAGLQILVGFKGGQPVPLDAYTQSGGERTTATMSFLLALQQHVRSPFRAVDEYDIHMDPKNREIIAKMLISTVQDSEAQYIVITPSQITFAKENVNIITVQNIDGKSIIRKVT